MSGPSRKTRSMAMHWLSLETIADDMTDHDCENIDFSKVNMAQQQQQQQLLLQLQLRPAQSYPSINCSIDTEVILTFLCFKIKLTNNEDLRQSCSRARYNWHWRLHAISCGIRRSTWRGGRPGRAHRIIRTHDGRIKSGRFCTRMESTPVNQSSSTMPNNLQNSSHLFFFPN